MRCVTSLVHGGFADAVFLCRFTDSRLMSDDIACNFYRAFLDISFHRLAFPVSIIYYHVYAVSAGVIPGNPLHFLFFLPAFFLGGCRPGLCRGLAESALPLYNGVVNHSTWAETESLCGFAV